MHEESNPGKVRKIYFKISAETFQHAKLLTRSFSVGDVLKYFYTGFEISCNLHEILNPVLWGNKKRITNLSSAESEPGHC